MPPNRSAPRSATAMFVAACAAAAAVPLVVAPARAVAATGPSVGPCPLLPADNVWNTDISALPVNARSADWIASSGGSGRLIHPDWGPSGGSVPYGIPWQVVDGSHQKVTVTFQYPDESDPGPYPLGPDTPIEGGANSTGDRHALVVDSSTCKLYETFNTYYSPSGSTAGSGAIFGLGSDALRPAGWTSADAAGLPILPGLVRYTEMRSGAIRHAIRFTVAQTDTSYIWPARHQAGARSDPTLPPMGARFRLKQGVDISRFSADTQVILTAMQHYGLIVADNGSNWFFQGDTDPGWSNADQVLSELKTVPAGSFEAVDESSLMIDPSSGAARQPTTATAPPAPLQLTVAPPPPTSPPSPVPATPEATPAPSPTAEPSPLALASPSPSESSATPAIPSVAVVRDIGAAPPRGGGGGPAWALIGGIAAAAALVALAAAVLVASRVTRRRRRS